MTKKSEMNSINREIIPVGTHVRVLLEKTLFQKTKPLWSDQIYTVKKYVFERYALEETNELFSRDQLQIVNKDKVMTKP